MIIKIGVFEDHCTTCHYSVTTPTKHMSPNREAQTNPIEVFTLTKVDNQSFHSVSVWFGGYSRIDLYLIKNKRS